MNIITDRDVKVRKVVSKHKSACLGCAKCAGTSNCSGCPSQNFSGIDGSNKDKVREFQVWANIYHSAQLAPDGLYGPDTKKAYNHAADPASASPYGPDSQKSQLSWGAEWEKTQPAPAEKVVKTSDTVVKAADKIVKVADTTVNTADAAVNAGVKLADKWKALSTPKKAGIIGGGALVVIGGIYLLWKLL
jgi:hypothetical protein